MVQQHLGRPVLRFSIIFTANWTCPAHWSHHWRWPVTMPPPSSMALVDELVSMSWTAGQLHKWRQQPDAYCTDCQPAINQQHLASLGTTLAEQHAQFGQPTAQEKTAGARA
jgi:hypothetical protein